LFRPLKLVTLGDPGGPVDHQDIIYFDSGNSSYYFRTGSHHIGYIMTREELESKRDIFVQEVVKGHYDNYSEEEKKFFLRQQAELYIEDLKLQILEAMDKGKKINITQDNGDVDRIYIEIFQTCVP
jgi:hypothetical protein